MNKATVAQQAKTASFLPFAQGILQRTCASCGNHTIAGRECTGCAKNKSGLQRKLAIGASNDPLEREADRVADQIMTAPAHSAVSATPPRIQRFSGQSNGQMDAAPASVDSVLAGSGRPLEPALRHDMEQRFGHDFSRVRVHSDAAAEQSARDVNAHAYTVGHQMVFGAGRFAPATHAGRRLIAHELTHVAQQGGEGDLIQRAPANYPSNDPIAAQTGPKPDSSAKKSKPQLTPDDWIWMLENFRRQSPQEFVKFLAANEGFFYPILKPHGFRGSWTKDQAYLDDFDAAIVKWGKSHIYSLRFANISQTVSQQKPKSREEQKYEYAQYLVRDMNRHGYGRGKVNDELESYGLMDDLVSHGFEKHDKWSFKNHEEYKNEAIVALNDYIDRYDAAHGNKRQTSANVPTQGEDVEFYRAWLEGLGYVTSSFFAAAFANTASKFTSDPKKITGAAGAGAAFEGVVFSVAGALGGGGSYRPDVVGPRDRPAAVAPWRYTGKQPIKPVVDPAKVGAPPTPDRIPTPDPVVIDPVPAANPATTPKPAPPPAPSRPMRAPPGGGPRAGMTRTAKTSTPHSQSTPTVEVLPRGTVPMADFEPAPAGHYIVRKPPSAETQPQILARAGRTTDGRLRDANTGRALDDGEAVWGHAPYYQFAEMRDMAESLGWTQAQFDAFFENPAFWQIEYGPSNSGRVFDRIPRQRPVH